MSLKSNQVIEQLQAVYDRLKRPLIIVETGTIRQTEPQYVEGDGHSTTAIAEWVRDNGGMFYSIDTSTKKCESYLKSLRLAEYVSLQQGWSKDILPMFNRIDFAYLDSSNIAENTLDEFKIVWPKVPAGGCVMVDDCNEKSAELFKGDLLMPYLRQLKIEYTELNNQLIIKK